MHLYCSYVCFIKYCLQLAFNGNMFLFTLTAVWRTYGINIKKQCYCFLKIETECFVLCLFITYTTTTSKTICNDRTEGSQNWWVWSERLVRKSIVEKTCYYYWCLSEVDELHSICVAWSNPTQFLHFKFPYVYTHAFYLYCIHIRINVIRICEAEIWLLIF